MSVVWMDSFAHYATADLAAKYADTGTGTVSISAGNNRDGVRSALLLTSNQPYLRNPLPANRPTVIFTVAMKYVDTGFNNTLFALLDSGSYQCCIDVDSSGHVRAFRGNSSGTLLGTSATTPITSSTRHYLIEAKFTIDNTTGAVTVKVDGATVLSLTGLDTQATANAYATHFQIGGPGASVTMYFSDYYVLDDQGSVNNDFAGDMKVEALLPSGAGTTTQWTPSAGSNYACVDDAAPNGDTDYISSATAGQIDTYVMGNLGTTSGAVLAVQHVHDARKDDVGTRTIQPMVRSGGANSAVGSGHNLSSSYLMYTDIQEQDPATSAAWTISGVNAVEAGVKLVA